jgi:hypothetical protein
LLLSDSAPFLVIGWICHLGYLQICVVLQKVMWVPSALHEQQLLPWWSNRHESYHGPLYVGFHHILPPSDPPAAEAAFRHFALLALAHLRPCLFETLQLSYLGFGGLAMWLHSCLFDSKRSLVVVRWAAHRFVLAQSEYLA